MTGAVDDSDARLLRDPRTSPHQLADIAARRRDLHPLIAAHPQAYPALRQWIAGAGAGGVAAAADPAHSRVPPYATPVYTDSGYPIGYSQPAPPPARSGMQGWMIGCGCAVMVTLVAVTIGVIIFIGAASRSSVSMASAGIDVETSVGISTER